MSIARPPIAILAALAVVCALTSATIAAGSDKPVKKIEEGLLDEIELYVATLPSPADLTVIVQPFTSDKAELGTGNKQVATMGAAGGDSIKKMTGDCKSIGEDIAKFLSARPKGKKLD
jgi:hypothetical protein